MNPAGLDIILRNAACRGAFAIGDDGLTPLTTGAKTAIQSAQRTFDLWTSLEPVVSDAGLMIGQRGNEQSIACAHGGIIVEASGPLNLGILKSALQQEDRIQLPHNKPTSVSLTAGQIALWNLADWISSSETARRLQVHCGEKTVSLLAQRGKFACPKGQSVAKIAKTLLDAGNAGTSIQLSFGPLPDKIQTCDRDPLELFGATVSDNGEWVLKSDGTPVSVPTGNTLSAVRGMAVLAQQLTTWREGLPFELAVLRDGRIKEVVATSDTLENITFRPNSAPT